MAAAAVPFVISTYLFVAVVVGVLVVVAVVVVVVITIAPSSLLSTS